MRCSRIHTATGRLTMHRNAPLRPEGRLRPCNFDRGRLAGGRGRRVHADLPPDGPQVVAAIRTLGFRASRTAPFGLGGVRPRHRPHGTSVLLGSGQVDRKGHGGQEAVAAVELWRSRRGTRGRVAGPPMRVLGTRCAVAELIPLSVARRRQRPQLTSRTRKWVIVSTTPKCRLV